MLNNDLHSSISAGEQDRRDALKRGNRFLGRVVACSGSRATIAAIAEHGETSLTELWSVGRLISITVGDNRVVALVYSMQTATNEWGEELDNTFRIEVELMGEVHLSPNGREEFSAGITQYPYLGAIAHRIRSADLARIYDTGKNDTCVIGKLTQDESLDAAIHVPSMLSKHFAIVGTTGVGKSTAVSLLLHKAIASDPKLRVLILDPHNEFAAAFPDIAVVIDTDNLDLPFWLMRLDEFAEVIFRGRPPVPEELDMLRDVDSGSKTGLQGLGGIRPGTPDQREKLDHRRHARALPHGRSAGADRRAHRQARRPLRKALSARAEADASSARSTIRATASCSRRTRSATRSRNDLADLPHSRATTGRSRHSSSPASPRKSSTRSPRCSAAWRSKSRSGRNGAVHMLVVCEEAHRYVPSDPNLGFFPTRQAIARIAKEGRKYGCSLGIITQRPGELDQTILSQCSTIFSMRLSNDLDQEIIRTAIPGSSISTTSFISSIANGEAIAFGEAVAGADAHAVYPRRGKEPAEGQWRCRQGARMKPPTPSICATSWRACAPCTDPTFPVSSRPIRQALAGPSMIRTSMDDGFVDEQEFSQPAVAPQNRDVYAGCRTLQPGDAAARGARQSAA